MQVKAFHHVCIQTSAADYDASLKFYVEVLGFKVIKVNEGFHTRAYNTWLEMPHMKIELQTPKEGTSFNKWSKFNSGPVHLAFVVDDVQEAYEYFVAQGHTDFKIKNGKVVYAVNENTTIFKVLAPEGTEIEIRDNPLLD